VSADPEAGRARPKPVWRRFLPLAVLLAAIVAAKLLGLDDYLTFDALRRHHQTLSGWVDRYGVLAGVGYVAVYALIVAMSLPGAVFLTLAGGFMFGAVLGTLYTVVAATIGATAIYLIATTALGDALRKRAGPTMRKMEEGFRRNAFSYLLVLRLMPLFPFWLVNLVPALLGVSLWVYVAATFVGIIPATAVFSLAGAGLGEVLDSGESFSIKNVLSPTLIAALVGLAILSLLPVLYRWWRARRR